jgi:hypothetical protein
VQIFGGPQVEGQAGAGGVVDGPVQGEQGPTVLEPGEGARVELHEGAPLGFRGAASADLAPPPAALGGQAKGATEAPDRAAADWEALHLAQLLGGMAIVEARVRVLQQRRRPVAELGRHPTGGGPAAQAVEQPARALRGEANLQPLKLSDAQVQGVGSLGIADLPGPRRLEQPGPGHFFAAHRECLPCLHGVTFL